VEVLQAIRDVAVIILAILNIVVLLIVGFLLLQVWKLVGFVRGKASEVTDSATGIIGTVKDTAQTAAETARTAQTTVTYVSDRTVRPVVELYSAVAAAEAFVRALFTSQPRNHPDNEVHQ
jgi:hypothetical protein